MSETSEAAATGQAPLPANPLGTDGFEFVEYTAPDTRNLARLFESMGFSPHCAAPLQGCGALPAREASTSS